MLISFLEMPSFDRFRASYLDDEAFSELQSMLMETPDAGDVIRGTGGLRKCRLADAKRQKGRRAGLRIIYYWHQELQVCWLFAIYDKNAQDDMTSQQKRALKQVLEIQLKQGKTL